MSQNLIAPAGASPTEVAAAVLAAQLLELVQCYLETATLQGVRSHDGRDWALLGFEGVVWPQQLPAAAEELDAVAFRAAHDLLDTHRKLPPSAD